MIPVLLAVVAERLFIPSGISLIQVVLQRTREAVTVHVFFHYFFFKKLSLNTTFFSSFPFSLYKRLFLFILLLSNTNESQRTSYTSAHSRIRKLGQLLAPVSILSPCLYSKQKVNNVKSPDEKSSESQDFKIQSTTFQYAQQQKGLTRCLKNVFPITTF